MLLNAIDYKTTTASTCNVQRSQHAMEKEQYFLGPQMDKIPCEAPKERPEGPFTNMDLLQPQHG